jgi:hypothetical protein
VIDGDEGMCGGLAGKTRFKLLRILSKKLFSILFFQFHVDNYITNLTFLPPCCFERSLVESTHRYFLPLPAAIPVIAVIAVAATFETIATIATIPGSQ